MLHRIEVSRDLAAVSPAAQAVVRLAEGWEDEPVQAVDLALVEVLTNIIRHGPQDATGPILLEVGVEGDRITVDVMDDAPPVPVDRLERARAGTGALECDPDDVARIPEGGRGLALVLLMMDEVVLQPLPGKRWRLRLVRRR